MKVQVLDLKTNQPTEVDESSLPDILGSGQFAVPKSQNFEFEDLDGKRRIVPGEQVYDAVNSGFKLVPQEQVKHEEAFADAAERPVIASAAGLLRGVTLGLSDQILTRTGIATPDELKLLEEANPMASMGGEIAGTVAPVLASGGTGLLAKVASGTPAALAELAGSTVSKKLAGKFLSGTTSKVVENAIKLGAGSSVEGALYGLGNLVSEDALGDAEFNAENALAAMGKNALIGGAFGGAAGAAMPAMTKALDKAVAKGDDLVKKLAENGDVGILKWAGAGKREFNKIANKANLNEKDMADYAMSLARGFDDTADTISARGNLSGSGSDTLKNTLATSIKEMSDNNEVARQGAGKMMQSSLEAIENEFQTMVNSGASKLKQEDLVYGIDLAKQLEDEVITPMKDIISPVKDAAIKMRDELTELGIERDALGNIVKRRPLSPDTLKKQSIEFGKAANFEGVKQTGSQQVYEDLRHTLEDKLKSIMTSMDEGGELVKKYDQGKKLYEKSILMDKILENGLAREAANNRGFSITEGLATVAGGAVGGLPGAVAGYALRKGQRDYGDKVASYILRKIEKSANKGKVSISDSVDNFFKAAGKAGQIQNKAALKVISGQNVAKKDEDDIIEKVSMYSQDPAQIVDNFVNNNEDMLNVAPKTAQALQGRVMNAVQFLASKVPKKDESPFGDTQPSRADLLKFKNYVDAVEKPYEVLDNFKTGYISPESMEAFKVVYPKIYESLKQEIMQRMPEFKKITEKQKAELSRVLGLEAKSAYTPQGFMMLQNVSRAGVQSDLQQQNRVPTSASTKLETGRRQMSGVDRVIYRE